MAEVRMVVTRERTFSIMAPEIWSPLLKEVHVALPLCTLRMCAKTNVPRQALSITL